MIRRLCLLFLIVSAHLALCPSAFSQQVAIKTNLASDAFLNPNLGIEVGLSPHWTIEFSEEYNNWTSWDDQKWKHWTLQAEGRYWLCERWMKHFFGLHVLGGEFDAEKLNMVLPFTTGDMKDLDEFRHKGQFYGVGLGYGYDWILGKHWNLEAELGLGYIHSNYDKFNFAEYNNKVASGKKHDYLGLTKAAISILYLF